ncbi:unnamed protein product [Peronospora belbahrii]|uniref:Uncharacterized protein n=1 Tax=Peronospora belbahrii TaxID=622444 RepID=A0AAU9L7K9_9STRA|nr:unnamed protein product [Peronospora belbahrii]
MLYMVHARTENEAGFAALQKVTFPWLHANTEIQQITLETTYNDDLHSVICICFVARLRRINMQDSNAPKLIHIETKRNLQRVKDTAVIHLRKKTRKLVVYKRLPCLIVTMPGRTYLFITWGVV